MRWRRRQADERRVEQLLAGLDSVVTPPEDVELRALARKAAGAVRPATPVRPPRLHWVLAVAAALVVGSGFGFGVSAWKTPEGSAGTRFVGFGFLPAKGWTVVQSGAAGATAATAIAANVPLHPDDAADGVPLATLASLPPSGVVVVATFALRGALESDVSFPARRLPLRFADAGKASAFDDPLASSPRLSHFRLRAGVGAYNVDARIYFGGGPSAGMIAAAQGQLNRLLVGSERITIATRDRVLRRGQPYVTLFGSLENAKPDEQVTIEGKECGPHAPFFRPWGPAARTRLGGGWSTPAFIQTTTAFRARSGDALSAVVTVQARAGVFLQPIGSARQFEVRVGGVANFWRKRVDIERYDPRLGTWSKVRSVVLTESRGQYSAAKFTVRVPRGTLIRAVFPLSQARPCYLAGYSQLVRA